MNFRFLLYFEFKSLNQNSSIIDYSFYERKKDKKNSFYLNISLFFKLKYLKKNMFKIGFWIKQKKTKQINKIVHKQKKFSLSFFFNSFDDPDQSTSFYTSFGGASPIRISSEFGNGWYSANTQINWHIGANNTQRNRYAILFINNLELK